MVLKRRISLRKKEKAINIGEVIKRLRNEKGLSQEELAHRSKLDRSYMSDLETDKKAPSLISTFKLAYGLAMEPDELVKEIKEHSEIYRIIEMEEE
jgi:transcriptional regulator with XRE-family HTH domain